MKAERAPDLRAAFGPDRLADVAQQTGSTTIDVTHEENAGQVAKIVAAVERAKQLVSNALVMLATPAAPRVQRALQDNFHTTEPDAIDKIRKELRNLAAVFNGTIPIEVGHDNKDRGRVYSIWGNIHLYDLWFADPDPDQRARTVIHECMHKYGAMIDHAYHWNDSYRTLSPKSALSNPDSYAWLCIDLSH